MHGRRRPGLRLGPGSGARPRPLPCPPDARRLRPHRPHRRQPPGTGPALHPRGGPPGPGAGVPLLVGGRGRGAGGLLHPGRRVPGGPGAGPGHGRAGPAAAHPASPGHGRRHPAGPGPGAGGDPGHRHLLARRGRALARHGLRGPPPGSGEGVRDPVAGVPVGRARRLRRRLLPDLRLPPGRAPGRASAQDRDRSPQPGHAAPGRGDRRRRAAQLPPRLPRALVGGTGPQGRRRHRVRLRPRGRVPT